MNWRNIVKILFVGLLVTCFVQTSCAIEQNELTGNDYWFPLIKNVGGATDNYRCSIYFYALEPETTAYLDLNYNDALDAGEPIVVTGSNGRFSEPGGSQLISDKPIQAFFYYSNDNSGCYDDQRLNYPAALPGTEFIVPHTGVVNVVATEDNVVLTIGNLQTVSLEKGQIFAQNVNSGDRIHSDKPVAVTLYNYNRPNLDNSWAVTLLPLSMFDTEFWIPQTISPLVYNSPAYAHQQVYITYADGTIEILNTQENMYQFISDQPAAAYFFFDIYSRDWWASVYRHYACANEIFPYSLLNTEYIRAGAVYVTRDNTLLQIDYENDGIIDEEKTLNAGDVFNPFRRIGTAHYADLDTVDIGHISANNPVQVGYFAAQYWSDKSEAVWAYTVNPCVPIGNRIHDENLPDLKVNNISLNIDDPGNGDDVTFSCILSNTGEANAAAFGCKLYVDDVEIDLASIDQLAAGTSWEGSFDLPWIATAGTHTVRVKADWQNVIAESNEGNNILTKTIEVAETQQIELLYPSEPMIDFGEIGVGDQSVDWVEIKNNGNEKIEMSCAISGEAAEEFSFVINNEPLLLDSGEQGTILVMIDPTSSGTKNAILRITGTELNSIDVDLTGQAYPQYHPKFDGYYFPNYGDEVCWEFFKETYDIQSFDLLNLINPISSKIFNEYNRALLIYGWYSYNSNQNPGSCYGMATSSQIMFQSAWENNLLEERTKYLGTGISVRDDPIPENWNVFINYPDFLQNIEDWIEYYQIIQLDNSCIWNERYGFENAYNEIKSRLDDPSSWIENPIVLSIVWEEIESGKLVTKCHAVAPFKVNGDTIEIYDPNSQQTPVDITFDADHKTARYRGFDLIRMSITDLSAVKKKPVLPTSFEAIIAGGKLLASDSDGNYLGYVDNEFRDEIPDTKAIFLKGDSNSDIPVFYAIPEIPVNREIFGTGDGMGKVIITKPHSIVVIESMMTTNTHDLLNLPPDGSSIEWVSEGGTSSVKIELTNELTEKVRVVTVQSDDIEPNEGLSVDFTENNESIEICNIGSGKTLNIKIENVDTDYSSNELSNPLALESNSRMVITPESWDDLANTYIKVEYDIGNDDTIDKTEIMTGLVASVDINPDVINLGSNGNFVTAFIELPQEFDPSAIVEDSVCVATVNGQSIDLLSIEPRNVGDYDEDDIPDLMVKFDRQIIADSLSEGEHEITLLGQLNDGTYFSGMDSVTVKSSPKQNANKKNGP
ncbi:hypothetical protein L1S32_06340 [Methanogenium sp. S4BF]|uniref:CARDB domain-containing protein n=1 Tax=Methanogenium sp. S4BF TaxID=1789226 RepID=UPI0024160D1A|nr:CARDB domain-containing protein [Methanogenium sp. S4BF]WFN33477.1 hypothetical protein L1S32_06340 [Methanogenium sp. S4BF]